ncbi:MAG: hypothetical protein LQ344_005222 [Seirophora lacunosa]|nr:MAG: hypothetical protein LQ344_005222 [Seirophora lacunosa]
MAMEDFLSRKKRRIMMPPLVVEEEEDGRHPNHNPTATATATATATNTATTNPLCFEAGKEGEEEESDSTDLKLAMLASLFPDTDQATLLDVLLAADGSVGKAREDLSAAAAGLLLSPLKKKKKCVGYQTSLAAFQQQQQQPPKTSTVSSISSNSSSSNNNAAAKKKALTKKGQTLHLYAPQDIEAHTPCSIIHNFLPAAVADDLLRELLDEAPTFERQVFKLFDNVVQSPHSACFYVDSLEERRRQQTEYLYNGHYLTDIREITPQMRKVREPVKIAVNKEIARRVREHYPGGKKLKYQSPKEWVPNAAFVNCYQGGSESVGYHCDQLTYLGPRAIIGSISLGVAREFRVRKIVARNEPEANAKSSSNVAMGTERADAEGQIAIHLPHNSLLVMHAEMQEEW